MNHGLCDAAGMGAFLTAWAEAFGGAKGPWAVSNDRVGACVCICRGGAFVCVCACGGRGGRCVCACISVVQSPSSTSPRLYTIGTCPPIPGLGAPPLTPPDDVPSDHPWRRLRHLPAQAPNPSDIPALKLEPMVSRKEVPWPCLTPSLSLNALHPL